MRDCRGARRDPFAGCVVGRRYIIRGSGVRSWPRRCALFLLLTTLPVAVQDKSVSQREALRPACKYMKPNSWFQKRQQAHTPVPSTAATALARPLSATDKAEPDLLLPPPLCKSHYHTRLLCWLTSLFVLRPLRSVLQQHPRARTPSSQRPPPVRHHGLRPATRRLQPRRDRGRGRVPGLSRAPQLLLPSPRRETTHRPRVRSCASRGPFPHFALSLVCSHPFRPASPPSMARPQAQVAPPPSCAGPTSAYVASAAVR